MADRPGPPPDARKRKKKAKPDPQLPLFDPLYGKSPDGTLEWRSGVDSLGSPYFTFAVRSDGTMPEQSPAL